MSHGLYEACELGQTPVVDLILRDGEVNVNLRSGDGSTPLLIALKRGHASTVSRLLLVKGIDVNVQWVGNKPQYTPLMLAAENGDETSVSRLLHLRARIDARDENGSTALYCAVSRNEFAVVSRLLEARASPNIRRNDSSTPLQTAAERGFVAILALLKDAGACTTAKLADVSDDALLIRGKADHTAAVRQAMTSEGDPKAQIAPPGISTQEAKDDLSTGLRGPGDVAAIQATQASRVRREGNDLFDKGHFDAALRSFKRASELDLSCHLAPSNASQAAIEVGDYGQALEFAKVAFNRCRAHTKTWVRLVKALSFLRRASEALVWVADLACDTSCSISIDLRSELVQAIADSSPYCDAIHPGVCLERVEGSGYRVVAIQPIKVHEKISSEVAVVPWTWLDASRPDHINRFVTTVTCEQVQSVTGVYPRSYEQVPEEEVGPLRLLRPQIAQMLPRASKEDIDECIRLLGIAQLSSHDDGIHHLGSFINHSCTFNAELRGKHHLEIFACRDILVGEEICIPYLGSGLLNAHVNIRRLSFKKGWGLECCCVRCLKELQLDAERIARGDTDIDEPYFLEFQRSQSKLLNADKDVLLTAYFSNPASTTRWQQGGWEEVWVLTQYTERLDRYLQSEMPKLSVHAARDICSRMDAAGCLERVSRLLQLQLAYLPAFTMNLYAGRSALLAALQMHEFAECVSIWHGFQSMRAIRDSIEALILVLKQTDSV